MNNLQPAARKGLMIHSLAVFGKTGDLFLNSLGIADKKNTNVVKTAYGLDGAYDNLLGGIVAPHRIKSYPRHRKNLLRRNTAYSAEITLRPLYVPHFGHTRCERFAAPHSGHVETEARMGFSREATR